MCVCTGTHGSGRGAVRVSRRAALPELTRLNVQLHRAVEPRKNHYCKETSILLFHLPAWAQAAHVTYGTGEEGSMNKSRCSKSSRSCAAAAA